MDKDNNKGLLRPDDSNINLNSIEYLEKKNDVIVMKFNNNIFS